MKTSFILRILNNFFFTFALLAICFDHLLDSDHMSWWKSLSSLNTLDIIIQSRIASQTLYSTSLILCSVFPRFNALISSDNRRVYEKETRQNEYRLPWHLTTSTSFRSFNWSALFIGIIKKFFHFSCFNVLEHQNSVNSAKKNVSHPAPQSFSLTLIMLIMLSINPTREKWKTRLLMLA